MKIRIEQALYGYKNGHQLLQASCSISQENGQTLLLHSDLTGSNMDPNYKSYFTGFPLVRSNQFAICRTWYADDMQRPGCVWTHILLIGFADLGKIPNLQTFITLFQRPKEDEYAQYGQPIDIQFDELDFHPLGIDKTLASVQILNGLYNDVDRPVLIPAESSTVYAELIFQIWSNQWPRLRRNFTFCTGVLKFQFFNNIPFDLQVCPSSLLRTIARQHNDIAIINPELDEPSNFFSDIFKTDNNKLRRFLWKYGADVNGERRNYIPLIYLYKLLNENKPDISRISRTLLEYFNPSEAKLLKKAIFGIENDFNISQVDVVKHLVLSNGIDDFGIENANLENRLLALYVEHKLEIEELLYLWSQSTDKNPIRDIWTKFDLSDDEVLALLEKEPDLINVLATRIPSIAENVVTWTKSMELQGRLCHYLLNSSNDIDWSYVAFAILSAESLIITDLLYKKGGVLLTTALNFINHGARLSDLLFRTAISADRKLTFNWIRENSHVLDVGFVDVLFRVLQLSDFRDLDLSAEVYRYLYNKLCEFGSEELRHYGACILLSVGFHGWIRQSYLLVEIAFSDVFHAANRKKISKANWTIIPKQYFVEEKGNQPDFLFPLSLWGILPPKRRSEVPDWDFCELLIRSLAYKFISSTWPNQSFINALKDSETTYRALEYLMSFKKGRIFLTHLHQDLVTNRLKLADHHQKVFRRFSSN